MENRPVSAVAPPECSICCEVYTEEGVHKPKLLPCSHTVCLQCVQALVRSNKVECPECRVSHGVPARGVDKFPTNRYVCQNLQLAQKLQRARIASGASDGGGDGGGGDGGGGGGGGSGVPTSNPPPTNPYYRIDSGDDGAHTEPTAPEGTVVYEVGGDLMMMPESLYRELSQTDNQTDVRSDRSSVVVGRARDSDSDNRSDETQATHPTLGRTPSATISIPETGTTIQIYNDQPPAYPGGPAPASPVSMYPGGPAGPVPAYTYSNAGFDPGPLESGGSPSPATENKFSSLTSGAESSRQRDRRWYQGTCCKVVAILFGLVFIVAVGGTLLYLFRDNIF